jgi:subtilisin family serine protease
MRTIGWRVVLLAWAAVLLAAYAAHAQQPRRYMVRVRDVPDTGVVEQRVRRLGHEARNLTRNIVLVTERSRARGGKVGLHDSLLVLRRDRRAGINETLDIEEDVASPPADVGNPPPALAAWNVGLIHADAAWAVGYTGAGQKVGVLDSGYGPSNPDVTIGGGKNFAITTGRAADSLDIADNVGSCRGHGTHVAGTVAGKQWGVAPDATLYVLKVFADYGGQCLSFTSSQLAALRWAQDHGIWVVNVSIGGSVSGFLDDQITIYTAAGGLLCAAAGNSGGTPPLFPASAAKAIAVASVSRSLTRSAFSNTGAKLELSAPGENIVSDSPSGGTATKSGTSMSAPHCTGGYTLLRSAGVFGDSARRLMNATADPLGDTTRFGHGLMRPDQAIAAAKGGLLFAGPTTRVYTAPQLDSVRVVSVGPTWSPLPSISNPVRRGDYLIWTVVGNDRLRVTP